MGTAPAAPPVTPASTTAANGNGNQQQAQVATTERGVIPLTGGPQPESDQQPGDGSGAGDRQPRPPGAGKAARTMSAAAEGGLHHEPGTDITTVAPGVDARGVLTTLATADIPGGQPDGTRSGQGEAGAPGTDGAGANGQEGQNGVQAAAAPVTEAAILAAINQANEFAARAAQAGLTENGEQNADQVVQAVGGAAREGIDMLIRDALARPGGEQAVNDLWEHNPDLRPAIEAARKPAQATGAEQAAGTQGANAEQDADAAAEQSADTGAPVSEGRAATDLYDLRRRADVARRKGADNYDDLKAARLAAAHKVLEGVPNEDIAQTVRAEIEQQISERMHPTGNFVMQGLRNLRYHGVAGRLELQSMYRWLQRATPAEIDALGMRGVMEEAYAQGGMREDVAVDKEMGTILRGIHHDHLGLLGKALVQVPLLGPWAARRIPISREKRLQIAKDQLRAVTGQLSQDEIDKFKKGPWWWAITQVVLAAVVPVGWDALTDATAKQTQPTG